MYSLYMMIKHKKERKKERSKRNVLEAHKAKKKDHHLHMYLRHMMIMTCTSDSYSKS